MTNPSKEHSGVSDELSGSHERELANELSSGGHCSPEHMHPRLSSELRSVNGRLEQLVSILNPIPYTLCKSP